MVSRKERISATELITLANFPLETVGYLRDKTLTLKQNEKIYQSREHRWLVLNSTAIFRSWGYLVNRRCFGINGLSVASDYGMFKQAFYFVECLSSLAPMSSIFRKERLAEYAPLWFVISEHDTEKIRILEGWQNRLVLPFSIHPLKCRVEFQKQYPTEEIYKSAWDSPTPPHPYK